jgi:hypothetical protein
MNKEIEKEILIEDIFLNIDYNSIFSQISPYVDNLVYSLNYLKNTEGLFDFSDIIIHVDILLNKIYEFQNKFTESNEWYFIFSEDIKHSLLYIKKRINQSIFSTDISEMMENLDI